MSGKKVRAVGVYEKEVGGGLLMAFSSDPKATAKFQIEYDGTLNGRIIDGFVKRIRQEGTHPSALGIGDTSIKVLMSIGEDNIIKAIENPYSGNPSYYEMKML